MSRVDLAGDAGDPATSAPELGVGRDIRVEAARAGDVAGDAGRCTLRARYTPAKAARLTAIAKCGCSAAASPPAGMWVAAYAAVDAARAVASSARVGTAGFAGDGVARAAAAEAVVERAVCDAAGGGGVVCGSATPALPCLPALGGAAAAECSPEYALGRRPAPADATGSAGTRPPPPPLAGGDAAGSSAASLDCMSSTNASSVEVRSATALSTCADT